MSSNPTPARNEHHSARARAILEGQLAEGLEAIERNKGLEEELGRARALLALADDRVAQMAARLAATENKHDFYMRYGSAVSARLEHIFEAVKNASQEIGDCGASFDRIAKEAHEQGNRAHQAYLQLSSLLTMIETARLDARDAAFAPKLEGPKTATVQDQSSGGDEGTAAIAERFKPEPYTAPMTPTANNHP